MKLPVFDVANSPKHYPATDLETVDESEFKSKKQRERERERVVPMLLTQKGPLHTNVS